MRRWILAASLGAVLSCASSARAQDQLTLPANTVHPIVGLTGVDALSNLPAQRNAEPPLEPVPEAECGPGSRPLVGEQGRVPAAAIDSPESERGWTCNLEPVGTLGVGGGWKVWRYIDRAGRECAFLDSSSPHPLAVGLVGASETGVSVLDMRDPSRPVRTALLRDLPMQSPHESLHLHAGRGLLVAEMGSGLTAPGLMSVYDVSQDCRHPVLRATTQAARFGHESGFSPDGLTFWLSGGVGLAAVDLTNPSAPRTVWEGSLYAHGLSVSHDGTRLYVADPINAHFVVLDVTEVQARRPDPRVREVSRLTWGSASIPQNTAPMTIDGRPYALEFDEFAYRFTALPQDGQQVGAARIIDLVDETRPRVVSNLRLSVNQRDRHLATLGDPGALNPVQGYAAHYCAVPREVDPQIVACSFIASGLRIFDVRDPLRPREVAYYVAPPVATPLTGGQRTNSAMSKPDFVPERREVWYSDVNSGFHAVRLDPSVWPDPVASASRPCTRRRALTVRLAGRPALRSVAVRVDGRRARARVVGRGAVRVTLPATARTARYVVRVRAVTRRGRVVRATRRPRACPAAARAPATGRVVQPRTTPTPAYDAELAQRVDVLCRVRKF